MWDCSQTLDIFFNIVYTYSKYINLFTYYDKEVVYLKEENFGKYFQSIRKSKNITQSEVANYVNRKKMTISLIENNKNEPPNGDLLKNMIDSLSLDDQNQISKLYLLASRQRKMLPSDIEDYFFSNEEIYNSILRGMKSNKKNEDWEKIFR